jgi:Zn finger protein HypA/HybF involved in hydrogenase expression
MTECHCDDCGVSVGSVNLLSLNDVVLILCPKCAKQEDVMFGRIRMEPF